MRFLIFFMIGILLFNPVSAEVQSLPPQKLNECMVIPQSHPNVTQINVTKIKYPNSTEDYTIQEMASDNGFNFYYEFCDTNAIGTYLVTTCGDGDGVQTCVDYDFEVTPSGFTGTLGFYILIFALSLGIVLMGFGLADAPITLIGSFGLYFVGLYMLFNGIDGLRDPTYTWALSLLTLGLAFYISTRSAYELIIT